MFATIIRKLLKDDMYNGCKLQIGDIRYHLFLVLDSKNFMGLGFYDSGKKLQIKIIEFWMNDIEALKQMLDGLVLFAQETGYKKIQYTDGRVSDQIRRKFLEFGFEEETYGESYIWIFNVPEKEDENDGKSG